MTRNRGGFQYPIDLPIEYELQGENRDTGHGRTRVISSQLIHFEADRGLPENCKVRLTLAWPAALPDGTALNLWIFGTITRSILSEIEVEITKYEFRTRSRACQPDTFADYLMKPAPLGAGISLMAASPFRRPT